MFPHTFGLDGVPRYINMHLGAIGYFRLERALQDGFSETFSIRLLLPANPAYNPGPSSYSRAPPDSFCVITFPSCRFEYKLVRAAAEVSSSNLKVLSCPRLQPRLLSKSVDMCSSALLHPCGSKRRKLVKEN